MEPIRALGAMSGTSLDGVDAAELWTDGETIHRFGASRYAAYSDAERAALRSALGCWPGEAGVEAAAEVVERVHARLLAGFPEAELLGFHGQTLAHDPGARRTHQVGDGARLARLLGKPVAWDFRTADVAQGGEGAPLAPAFHFACARHLGADEPLAFLNLGGVGNLTWVDPGQSDMAAPGALLAFDTGPANAPLNDLAMRHLGEPVDRDGALARAGRSDAALAAALLDHPFFHRLPPKSLDRNAFHAAGAAIDALAPPDASATWVAVIAGSVRLALARCPKPPARLLVTGGGRHNPAIMAALGDLPCEVAPVEAANLDGDMLEAQAFAFLAVRALRGLPTSFPGTTGVPRATCGGRISAAEGMAPPVVPDGLRAGRRAETFR
jgi:anhydro-N-acetylmuramic acid kinase